jgi:hypothetical protein
MIQMATTTRFDHSNCDHAKSGNEGKKARAICRREHAKQAEEAAKKPVRKRTATRKPAAAKVSKVPVSTPREADDLAGIA